MLDVAPSRQEIAQRIEEMAAGCFTIPVLVLGIDGAYVPPVPTVRGSARRAASLPVQTRSSAQARGEIPRASGFISSITSISPCVELT